MDLLDEIISKEYRIINNNSIDNPYEKFVEIEKLKSKLNKDRVSNLEVSELLEELKYSKDSRIVFYDIIKIENFNLIVFHYRYSTTSQYLEPVVEYLTNMRNYTKISDTLLAVNSRFTEQSIKDSLPVNFRRSRLIWEEIMSSSIYFEKIDDHTINYSSSSEELLVLFRHELEEKKFDKKIFQDCIRTFDPISSVLLDKIEKLLKEYNINYNIKK